MTEPAPDPLELRQIYRERFAGSAEYRRRVWAVLVSKFFAKWIAPDAVVLDLGCGHCEFINQVSSARRYGMDLNPDSAGQAGPGVMVIQHDCSLPWPLAPGSIDVVFTSNFLEHLPTKAHLERTLRHVRLALKPGGLLIAMGPNIKHVGGAYWDFFDHHLALTEASLAEVLKLCGFLPQTRIGRFLPYTMSNQKIYPLWMLRLYLAVPVLWPLVGRQFLVIARKP